ncbi:SSI family serine proteinase inhibitor [Microlunatus ginsengisoli]|uniref:SSI family serine proteinase inhibitor n=1 Tax=Microlunatus ginsengisoli TaxID=363863 RepID=A0ABP6ZED8_9ACTN
MKEPVGGRLLGLGATILLLGLLGCRSTASGEPSTPLDTPAPTPATAATAGPTAELTIVVDPGNGAATTTWRLSCDPAGGDHPDPVGACQALEVNGASALPPVPKDRACTMIYGGPERATVTGTMNGAKVKSTFTRTNGCEIDRWSQLVPLLPEPTG